MFRGDTIIEIYSGRKSHNEKGKLNIDKSNGHPNPSLSQLKKANLLDQLITTWKTDIDLRKELNIDFDKEVKLYGSK